MSAPSIRKVARQIPLRRQVLFVAVCLVFIGVLCETAVRVRAWMKYGAANSAPLDTMLVRDPASNIAFPRPGYRAMGRNTSLSINSLGFRGAEITKQKPTNTLRIVCVGASTTFDADVSSDDATWPAVLQQRLREQYPDVSIEVINAGVPGFVITQSLENVRRRVLPLDPDLVIFYEANNDVALDTRELAVRMGLVNASRGRLAAVNRWLTQKSLLLDLIEKNLKILSVSDESAGKIQTVPEDLPTRYVRELDRMHEELRAEGVDLLLSTFLVKYRRDQPRAEQIENARLAFFYMPWMTIDGLLNAMDLYNAAIVSYGRTRGVPVVDDRTAVPADREHFVDWAHMTDAGCVLMAERFRRYLETSGIGRRLVDRVRSSS
ncbi:MAG: SGNH/GDSL hydrolase family protein [Vicinamibacterales bacterium]